MKKISMIGLILLILIFAIPFKVHAAGVDISKCVSEDLATTFNVEGITCDMTKYNKKNDKRINIYVFRGNGCINCKNFYQSYVANKLLASHGDKIKIISYEVKNNTRNYNLLDAAKTLVKEQSNSGYATPTVFIGNKTFSGDLVVYDAAQKQAEIEEAINVLYNSNNRYDIIEELAGKNVFTDNTANVTLTSAERLDKSYTLRVSKIDLQNLKLEDGYDYMVAYDISMYNGNVVVPLSKGSYKIKIPINAKYDTYKVGYVKDGKIQEDFKTTYNNGFIEFTTTHLSEYVVYGTNNTSTNPDTKPNTKPETNPNPDTKPEAKPDNNQSTNESEKPNTNPVINENTDSETDKNESTNTDTIVKETVKDKEVENQQNPKTFDGVQTYVILLGIGCVTLVGSVILFKKKRI